MPLRNFRSVSFVEANKKHSDDPCILRSINPIDDTKPVRFSTLPRAKSDPSYHTVIQERRFSNFEVPRAQVSSSPSSASDQFIQQEKKKQEAVVKVKRASSDQVHRAHFTTALISSPQPLNLHGLPNGLADIPPQGKSSPPVVRRAKENSPSKVTEQKRNRRRGVVWSEKSTERSSSTQLQSISISLPIESIEKQDNIELKPRSTKEQHILLTELAQSQDINYSLPASESEASGSPNIKTKTTKKAKPRSVELLRDTNQPQRAGSTGSKMADKIQRTIRALYDGNLNKRGSFSKLDEVSSEDELEPLKLKPVQLGSSKVDGSPKPDKRGTRKSRSPKSVRRMTVPIKDMDGSRRFKWRGSVNRIVRKFGQGQTLMQGGTFEVHLEDCPPSPNNELIPFVVELCCRIVEERGLSFTGIYRVPGNNGTLAALQDELNCRGADAVDLENDERFCELNVVSSLLKSFFRKLPDPLFTNELYDDFITMNRKQDPEERLNGLRRLIHMLPAPHYETLKFLIQHLRKIADNSEVNKMEVRNLAIVFGPTLVRSTISDNMATMVTDMSDQCRIVESVLQHAAWFFTEDEDQEDSDQIRPVPSEHHHEPVPNIDHLLANVGRTPGDVSDSTSESSKSKNSCTSEKESFSRDVMEMIFGAKKRWLQNPQRGGGKENAEESSDDEYGFKEAERNQARAVVERFQSPPKSPLTTSTTTTKYQVAKPAATGIRAGWPGKAQHLPSDIPARLYDFYIENLERLARTDPSRPLPYFSSSSTDTSPQVTPRSSQFEPHQPSVQRSYALQPRRCSDSKPPNGGAPSPPEATRQLSVPTSSPPQQYNPRAFDEPLRNQTNKMNQHVTMSIGNPLQSGKEIRSRLVPVQNQPGFNNISKEPCHSGEESDSDTSIYVGDTLEEKLKNLTNLDKKLERRPSRRVANRPPDMLIRVQPPAPIHPLNTSNKLLTAPSLKAGEIITPDNLHMYPSKKTTRELYQERKAQRQQHREFVKSKRSNRKESDLTRCASDENVFSRGDPKRQMIRSAACDDVSSVPPRRLRSSKEKVKRRHTLSGSDFPGQEFWDKSIYSSLQNIPRYAPGSAMARLRPQMGPASAVNNRLSVPRLPNYGANHISEKNRRTESYL